MIFMRWKWFACPVCQFSLSIMWNLKEYCARYCYVLVTTICTVYSKISYIHASSRMTTFALIPHRDFLHENFLLPRMILFDGAALLSLSGRPIQAAVSSWELTVLKSEEMRWWPRKPSPHLLSFTVRSSVQGETFNIVFRSCNNPFFSNSLKWDFNDWTLAE